MVKKAKIKFVKPSVNIVELLFADIVMQNIERYGRTCYKSQSKITHSSAEKFVRSLIRRGHLSVLEHQSVTAVVICDRGISHEIVRHRIASYSQESTRYVNYQKKGIEFIEPFFFKPGTTRFALWQDAMRHTANRYVELLDAGARPEEARSVLPNSLKTEIVMTYNLREWRHFFKLRCAKYSHPQMREVAIMLLKKMKDYLPVIFDDIKEDGSERTP